MKKTALLLLSLWMGMQFSSACDICGCGTLYSPGSSVYRAGQNSISMIWDQTQFKSKHLPSILKGQEGISHESTETFQRVSLLGQWRVFDKLQASLSIPYQITIKKGGSTERIYGLGDINLGLSYPLWNDSLGYFVHLLKFNFQLKMPSGRYQPERVSESISRYMFTGTGSWDQTLILSWAWMKKNWSFAWQGYYSLNGISTDRLNWGDGLGQALEAWYFSHSASLKYGLSGGLSQDSRWQDHQYGEAVRYSGYAIHSLSSGVALVWQNWVLESRVWMPFHQNIAKGQVRMNQRFQIKLQCLLP